MPWYEDFKIVGGAGKDEIWLSDRTMPVIPDNKANVTVIVNGRVLSPDMWAKQGPREMKLAHMTPGTTWHVKIWTDASVALGPTYETPGEHMNPANLQDPKIQQMISNEQQNSGGYH